jgi:hypothetical protein
MSKTTGEVLAPKPESPPAQSIVLYSLLDRVACTAYNDCIDVTA